MYYLINTMYSSENSIGRILSVHLAFRTARKAHDKIIRRIQRQSKDSYLPMRIICSHTRRQKAGEFFEETP